jgi:hypothetical protein
MLHLGEMFSSLDHLNGNPLFFLAKSKHVTDLIMDSNMALLGASSSPSAVALIIDIAREVGGGKKTIHYEAATERLVPCNNRGRLTEKGGDAAARLYRRGIQLALDSGVHALGFTNLCDPSKASKMLPGGLSFGALRSAIDVPLPTAVLYAPYRAFAGFKRVYSGQMCGTCNLPCWDASLSSLPTFGKAGGKSRGTCTQCPIQFSLLEIWDDLRTRHARVAVLGEAEQLASRLHASTERVHFELDGIGFDFFGGATEQSILAEHQKSHYFDVVNIRLGEVGCATGEREKVRKGTKKVGEKWRLSGPRDLSVGDAGPRKSRAE